MCNKWSSFWPLFIESSCQGPRRKRTIPTFSSSLRRILACSFTSSLVLHNNFFSMLHSMLEANNGINIWHQIVSTTISLSLSLSLFMRACCYVLFLLHQTIMNHGRGWFFCRPRGRTRIEDRASEIIKSCEICYSPKVFIGWEERKKGTIAAFKNSNDFFPSLVVPFFPIKKKTQWLGKKR